MEGKISEGETSKVLLLPCGAGRVAKRKARQEGSQTLQVSRYEAQRDLICGYIGAKEAKDFTRVVCRPSGRQTGLGCYGLWRGVDFGGFARLDVRTGDRLCCYRFFSRVSHVYRTLVRPETTRFESSERKPNPMKGPAGRSDAERRRCTNP